MNQVLRGARLPGGDDSLVDVTVQGGVVASILPAGTASTDAAASASAGDWPALPEVDLDGRWLIPGLWDNHVHFGQWAGVSRRLDVSAGTSAAETAALVGAAVASSSSAAPGELLVGYGFRDGLWADEPTAQLLDRVTGDRPVVLVSGDLHCCWLNSAALALVGVAQPTGVLREEEAFAVHRALDDVPAETVDGGALDAARAAAARGVVGIVDLEMAYNLDTWSRRLASGHDLLRVEFGVYPQHLGRAIAAGLRTGLPVGPAGASGAVADPAGARRASAAPLGVDDAGGAMVQVGPFKVITDGSLNTRTAFCFDEYPGLEARPDSHGLLTVPPAELRALLARAVASGFTPAVHAIGDHANRLALDAFEALGCGGSLEHAQLVSEADIPRFASLGVTASVQPEHAMDDRDVADRYWAGRTGRSFALASLLAAGARLALGSDAPVAPLDPWVTIAAAVGRTRDGRAAWHPEQRIPAAAALAASIRHRAPEAAPSGGSAASTRHRAPQAAPSGGSAASGAGASIRLGDVADLVALELDPLAATPDQLRTMPVALTLLAGRPTHTTL